jgi:peptidoglycan/LPS O-acetylase OafA/YrhL
LSLTFAVADKTGQTIPAPKVTTSRLPALDFTKGALVLFMILYHWLNYFVGFEADIYRYLRFLTPSFIFITGFLVSHIYLAKFNQSDTKVPKRLMQRGLKLLGVFLFLNATIVFLLPRSGRVAVDTLSLKWIVAVFAAGNTLVPGSGKAAAFPVLVPISYLLLLSAGLVIASRWYKYVFQVACGLLFLSVLLSGINGTGNANLDLLAIGGLGVFLGFLPIESLNRLGRHPYALCSGYVLYLVAITLWNVKYPLQVVGVCLTVALLYVLGSLNGLPAAVNEQVILLGKYSLLGYIAQIAVVQLLHRAMWRPDPSLAIRGVSLIAAFSLTMISVAVVDRLRKKSTLVNQVYKAVFA